MPEQQEFDPYRVAWYRLKKALEDAAVELPEGRDKVAATSVLFIMHTLEPEE